MAKRRVVKSELRNSEPGVAEPVAVEFVTRSSAERIEAVVAPELLRPVEVRIPEHKAPHVRVRDGVLDFWPRRDVKSRSEQLQQHGLCAPFILFGREQRAAHQHSLEVLEHFDFSPEAWAYIVMSELVLSSARSHGHLAINQWSLDPEPGERRAPSAFGFLTDELRKTPFAQVADWHSSSTTLLPGGGPNLGPSTTFGRSYTRSMLGSYLADWVLCRVLMCCNEYALVRVRTDETMSDPTDAVNAAVESFMSSVRKTTATTTQQGKHNRQT